MKKVIISIIIIICLFGCEDEPAPVTGIEGAIWSFDNGSISPLSGAIVTVEGIQLITDSAGHYYAELPAGVYNLNVSYPGFADIVINGVTVASGVVRNIGNYFFNLSDKVWNFIVYLDGDNNLEEFAISDVNEMEEVGSDDNANILVLIDRISGYDNTNGNWTGTRLYYITQDADTNTINSILLNDYGELDMSDPETLKDFILFCSTCFPADNTVLTLWNHGGGTYPRSPERNLDNAVKATPGISVMERGICWDDTTGEGAYDCLLTDEVAAALYSARSFTGEKIDIINMDACLMQMIEIAYEWRAEADFLVGSEANVPVEGNNYETLLETLKGTPLQTTAEFASALVDDYNTFYSVTPGTTYSALDLGIPFTNLMTAFDTLAAELAETPNMGEVRTAWMNTCDFDDPGFNDLGHFCEMLDTYCSDTGVTDAAAVLLPLLDLAVINNKTTAPYNGVADGLSVFIPQYGWTLWSEITDYGLLKISEDTDWNEFAAAFLTYQENN